MTSGSHTKFVLAVVALSLFNGILYWSELSPADEGVSAFPADFPSRISDWQATEVAYDPVVLGVLDPDRIVYKTYRQEGRLPVTLFLACYGTLEKADLSHSPIVCFTGQGWEITDTSIGEVSVSEDGSAKIGVNQMVQDKLATRMVSLHWYQSAHGAFTNRGAQKINLFFRSMLGKSDNNAFVRITAVVPRDQTVESAKTEMRSFVQDLYPDLRRYLQ